MITMSNISSAGAAGSYYSSDNYYTEGESKETSMWQGEGARDLGLQGKVDGEVFKDILSGKIGEQELGRYTGRDDNGNVILEHRPGYDITLSAPKSVSILAEVGGFKDVREAHEKAVSTVLEYIEKNLVGARVTKDGETSFEKTDNVIVARFEHNTSRALDPQTHTHLVFANATKTDDGVWRSLSNEGLYKNQKFLGALYDSELAANLRDKGYRLEATEKGKWEIAGVGPEHINEFSQRTRDIDAKLQEMGLTRETASADQREKATLATRESKTHHDQKDVLQGWKDRALGLDFASIGLAAKADLEKSRDATLPVDKANNAVQFALEHLGERESVFRFQEVKETALAHSLRESVWAGVRHVDIDKAIEHSLKQGTSLVVGNDREGYQLATTPVALEREQRMMTLLEQGREGTAPITSLAKVDEAVVAFEARKTAEIGAEFKMTSGQYDAAVLTLTSSDQYVGLQGYAGVGKTTMLTLVNEVGTQAGYKVVGMASSAEAATTLQSETGIPSVTTASFMINEDRNVRKELEEKAVAKKASETFVVSGYVTMGSTEFKSVEVTLPSKLSEKMEPAQRKELWVIDEASLAGQREISSVMDMANRVGAKVVISGDKLQLNAVESGKPFEMLLKHGIAQSEMTEINRQRVDDLKHAVAASIDRNNAKALSILQNRVVEIQDKGKLFDRVASDIIAKQGTKEGERLLIVPLNSDRNDINLRVREGLQTIGKIGPDGTKKDVLVGSGFTEAQRASHAYYEKDMVVRFGADIKRLDVKSGDYASVQKVDKQTKQVELLTHDGRTVMWNPAKNSKVEVYKTESRDLGIGDSVRITRNNKELGLNNGSIGTVKSIGVDGVTIESKGRDVLLDSTQRAHSHIDYSYAMTVYASQGKTVNDNSFLITADSGRAVAERAFRVGITRERDDLTIYTDNHEKAMKLITVSVDKSSVLETIDESGKGAKSSAITDNEGGKLAAKGSSATSGDGGKGDRSAGAER